MPYECAHQWQKASFKVPNCSNYSVSIVLFIKGRLPPTNACAPSLSTQHTHQVTWENDSVIKALCLKAAHGACRRPGWRRIFFCWQQGHTVATQNQTYGLRVCLTTVKTLKPSNLMSSSSKGSQIQYTVNIWTSKIRHCREMVSKWDRKAAGKKRRI